MPLDLTVPAGSELIEGPARLRLRGTARHLLEFVADLRVVASLPVGDFAKLGRWNLTVSDSPCFRERTIAMPQSAWTICASKFAEVATGREESPFEFGDCGYLVPSPVPDIGVELLGEPCSDMLKSQSEAELSLTA